MDTLRYSVRPHSDTDFEPESRIWSHLNPEQPVTAAELRQWNQILTAPGLFAHFLAMEEKSSGEVVATGSLNHAPWAFDPDRYWIGVIVEPSHQGRGLGRRLYRELEEVAMSRRAKGLWASVRSDASRGVRFFERTGFTEQRRLWTSRLDLTQLRPEVLQPVPRDWSAEGVVFTTVAEEGADRHEVRERMYRLSTVASKDVPRMGPYTPVSFEQFVTLDFSGPGFLPEGMFLARVGAEYVAMTTLYKLPASPDTLQVGFTGTHPTYRRRGIAAEIKRLAVEFARGRGYHYLRTTNDTLNRPMWAINERLGFRPECTWIEGEKELPHPR